MYNHPFVEKYNPENYQPEVYNFLADFSDEELNDLLSTKNQDGTELALKRTVNFLKNKYQFRQREKAFRLLNL